MTYPLQSLFNSPESLTELPGLITHTGAYKAQLSGLINSQIKEYNQQITNNTLQDDTSKLITNLNDLKSTSTSIQESITSMTSLIQSLDSYKRNLTLTMNTLQRLQMLVTAYNALTEVIPTHKYSTILDLLDLVKSLLQFFRPYKSIDEINQLHLMINATQAKLVDDIFLDFEEAIEKRADNPELVSGCYILQLVDVKHKDKLLGWYYNAQLKDITSIFNTTDEAGSLDNLGRRYLYFKNKTLLATKHHVMFPDDWNVLIEISKLFCKLTKDDVATLLGSSRVDSKILLENLSTTLEFEKTLNEQFKTNDFHQIISGVFEPYLRVWVAEQDKLFAEKSNEFLVSPQLPQEFEGSKSGGKSHDETSREEFYIVLKVNNVPNIANSSTELFKNFLKTLTQILKLSNGEILVDLAKLFIRYLFDFHNRILSPIIPKNDLDLGTGLEPLKYLTMLLNTGDYFINNIDELSEKLESLIKGPYKQKLPSFEPVKDVYYKLINSAISTLLTKISNDLKLSWRLFVNFNWESSEKVPEKIERTEKLSESSEETAPTKISASEVSSYMVEIQKVVTTNNLKFILPLIIRDSYVRNFNDKLVELLITALTSNLRSIQLIPSTVDQIIKDTSYLRDVSLTFPSYVSTDESSPAISKLYQKHVSLQFEHLHSLLKILKSPASPVEDFVADYFEIIGDNSVSNFIKVLQLRGISEQRYVESFKLQLTLSNSTVPAFSLLSNLEDRISRGASPEIKSPKIAPVKMNNFENHLRELALNSENQVSKLNENFKNFGKFFRNGEV